MSVAAIKPPHEPPPEFPALARQNGWYGTVLLKLWIDEEGRVTDVRVEKSSGYGVLDAAAVNAVKRWRGRPARHNARPVATEELLPVVFRPRLAQDEATRDPGSRRLLCG